MATKQETIDRAYAREQHLRDLVATLRTAANDVRNLYGPQPDQSEPHPTVSAMLQAATDARHAAEEVCRQIMELEAGDPD